MQVKCDVKSVATSGKDGGRKCKMSFEFTMDEFTEGAVMEAVPLQGSKVLLTIEQLQTEMDLGVERVARAKESEKTLFDGGGQTGEGIPESQEDAPTLEEEVPE